MASSSGTGTPSSTSGSTRRPSAGGTRSSAGGQPALDIQHFNAAEPDGKFLLLSFRHLDAVYKINRNTGGIVWKLGGIHTSKSLKVLKDPERSYPLGGQHDVRLLPDGTISIFDNFTGLGKPPRVVRYRIDEKANDRHPVQSFSDPTATGSPCCGSARMLASGDWLVSWGGSSSQAATTPRDGTSSGCSSPAASATGPSRCRPARSPRSSFGRR